MVRDYLVFSAILSLCFLLILPVSRAMAVDVPKHILIYGGNGFIGGSTAEKLIAAGHTLTLVNRGNWYWDSGFTVRPHVQLIQCDRFQPADKCAKLTDYVASLSRIDAVVDFSGYNPEVIKDTLSLVTGKCHLYIYISSDSVYEVSDKSGNEPSKETDAVRPSSKEEQDKMASLDSYGHRKLQCEETLADYRENYYGPRYVTLRLPDVFGPRDNTYRWWMYQMWIKMRSYLEKDVVVPEALVNRPISLVYVEDVANVIASLVDHIPDEAVDQVFNLAQKETPTLMNILEEIRNELNITDVEIKTSDKPETIRLYPSVYQGPVDTSKAEKILKWAPTDWKTALKATVHFYEEAIGTTHYDKARRDIIRKMQTYFTTKPHNVIHALRDLYYLNYPEPKDEL